MSDIFDNVKRLKVFEKILVAFGKNKIIFKDLEKPDEHQTVKITSDGIFDVHYTKEGKQKKYKPRVKINLISEAMDLLSKPEELEKGFKALVDGLKVVNFDEDEYAHLTIAIKSKEEIANIIQRKNKDVTIPLEALKDFQLQKLAMPWKSAKGKIGKGGIVFDKDAPVGFVQEISGKYCYFTIDLMKNSSLANLIKKMSGQKYFDAKRKEGPL